MRLPLLVLHILGGVIGLLAGTLAMLVVKGGRIHRASGSVFTLAMLTLAASGACLGVLKSQGGNIVGGIITFYLIGTGWLAGRRRDKTTLIDWAALAAGLAGGAAAIFVGMQTLHGAHNGSPAGMSFFLGAILLLAASGDMRMLARGEVSGRQRLTRHLWRMCFGLFIATGSFFLGQQQVFPAFLQGSVFLTIPAILPLALLVYWVLRVRFSKAFLPKRISPVTVSQMGNG